MIEIDNLNAVLSSFDIAAQCIEYRKVRNIGLYSLVFDIGARIKSIYPMLDELAMVLKAQAKPIVKLITSEGIVRLEVIEEKTSTIDFFDNYKKLSKTTDELLPVYLGSDIDGNDVVFDIAKNPHMIIAGATGSGKTTIINSLIANLLTYKDVEITLIDTKAIDFCQYEGKYPNLNIVADYEGCLRTIKQTQDLMNERYDTVKKEKCSADRYINPMYNEKRYVVIIDEYADLSVLDDGKVLQRMICNLASKCRAAGVFLTLCTQRPSAKIITGEIKANFPARIACKTSSGVDSRVVLDESGAENLSMRGDCLINNYSHSMVRFQAAYCDAQMVLKNIEPNE